MAKNKKKKLATVPASTPISFEVFNTVENLLIGRFEVRDIAAECAVLNAIFSVDPHAEQRNRKPDKIRLTVKHHQAVWETTTTEIEIASLADLEDFDFDELIGKISDEAIDIEQGDNVQSMDSDVEFFDDMGVQIRPLD